MKCRPAIVILFTIAFGLGAVEAQEFETKAAQAAVTTWLSLIDNMNYLDSWETAAAGFKSAITSEKWQTAVAAARAPFGQLKSRELKSATSTRTLPGAPDGEYVVFQFTTAFERKSAAAETVTAVRESDGSWRAGGYFIK